MFSMLLGLILSLAGSTLSGSRLPTAEPLTPKDVLSVRHPSDVQLSPNGRRVAFVVNRVSEAKSLTEQPPTKIWIGATDGTEPAHPLKLDIEGPFSPRWSPDGNSLAFLAAGPNEAPGSQVFLVRGDGGKAERITSVPGGVDEFQWSGDGTELLLSASNPPATETKEPQSDAMVLDKGAPRWELWVTTVADKKSTKVASLEFGIDDIAWSPDGQEIAIVRENPTKLVVVSRSTGQIVRTLGEHIGLPFGLGWSPDGRLITYYEGVPGDDTAWWLAVVPARGGPSNPLLKDKLLTVQSAKWAQDSKTLIAEIIEGTRTYLASIDTETGSMRKLADGVFTQSGYSLSTNGSVTAYLNEGPKSPKDVWVLPENGSSRQMTRLNPEVESWQLGEVREVQWKNSKDGLQLYGVLITPPGYDPAHSYPMVVHAHFGDCPWWPGWLAGWSLWGQMLATHGYVVFLPNTRGVSGQGWKLHKTISDWGGMAFQDLMDGVDSLVAKGIADPDRLGIGGWSNGGFMTEYAITHTTKFKAAVAEAGHSDFFSLFGTSPMRANLMVSFHEAPYRNRRPYDDRSPITHIRDCKTPTLVLHGEYDGSVPVTQGYEFHYALQSLGIETEMVVYPREGHGIGEPGHQLDLQTRVLAWFDRYLKR